MNVFDYDSFSENLTNEDSIQFLGEYSPSPKRRQFDAYNNLVSEDELKEQASKAQTIIRTLAEINHDSYEPARKYMQFILRKENISYLPGLSKQIFEYDNGELDNHQILDILRAIYVKKRIAVQCECSESKLAIKYKIIEMKIQK